MMELYAIGLHLVELYALAYYVAPGKVQPASFLYMTAAAVVIYLIMRAIMIPLEVVFFGIAGRCTRKVEKWPARIAYVAMYTLAYTVATALVVWWWDRFYIESWRLMLFAAFGPIVHLALEADAIRFVRGRSKTRIRVSRKGIRVLRRKTSRTTRTRRVSIEEAKWLENKFQRTLDTTMAQASRGSRTASRKLTKLLRAFRRWYRGEISFDKLKKEVNEIKSGKRRRKRHYRYE